MAVDLHAHTTASDGTLAPADLVLYALRIGLSALAITDHDTVGGIDAALGAAAGTSVEIIPGVELSVSGPDGTEAHILGYLIDHHSPALVETLSNLRDARHARARTMVQRLREAGHDLDFSHVSRHAGTGSVGRVHVARALVDAGSVPTVDEAFSLLIGRDRPFYVRKASLDAVAAFDVIHHAGGVAVLAHPGIGDPAPIDALVAAGLDGIEAGHAEHNAEQRARFEAIAHAHDLVVTGGSDFHGPGMKSGLLGEGVCPDGAVEALRERARILNP